MGDFVEKLKDNGNFTDQPVKALQHGPPSEVHFVGVFAANPRFQNTTVPSAHRSHELVKGRFFYTIPAQLLESRIGGSARSLQGHLKTVMIKTAIEMNSQGKMFAIGYVAKCRRQSPGKTTNAPRNCVTRFKRRRRTVIMTMTDHNLLDFSLTAVNYGG